MRIASLVYLLSFVAVLANASPLPSDKNDLAVAARDPQVNGIITTGGSNEPNTRKRDGLVTDLGPSPDKRGFQTFQARATAAGGGVGVTQGATPTSVAVG